MKFTLEDIEKDKQLKKKKNNLKKQPKYTDSPKEEIPYSAKDFTRYIDTTYEDQEYDPQ